MLEILLEILEEKGSTRLSLLADMLGKPRTTAYNSRSRAY